MGLSPQLAYWAYNAIVRPTLTYNMVVSSGSIHWRKKNFRNMIDRIQNIKIAVDSQAALKALQRFEFSSESISRWIEAFIEIKDCTGFILLV